MSTDSYKTIPFGELIVPEIRCYAPHGEYAEEAVVGGYFSVTVSLKYPAEKNHELKWVNYEQILGWVNAIMQEKKPWIEDLAISVYQLLREQISAQVKVRVKVVKEQPPLKGLQNVQFIFSDY